MKGVVSMFLSLLFAAGLGACSQSPPKDEPVRAEPASSAPSASASAPAPPPAPTTPVQVAMVSFKGGTFTMGTDSYAPGGELISSQPSRVATVAPFRIDVTEVTVEAYRRCVDAGACTKPANAKPEPYSLPCNWGVQGRDQHPINCVTLPQAMAYCQWAGKEVPTEEMWEFAAAGKARRDFPWGPGVTNSPWGIPADMTERLRGSCPRVSPRYYDDSCPVGSAPKGATPEGVLDLAGNVREWTTNDFCAHIKRECDPLAKTTRGGAQYWASTLHHHRSVYRRPYDQDAVEGDIGFRCAKSEGK